MNEEMDNSETIKKGNNLPEMHVIDDLGCFAIEDRYLLHHDSAELASDRAAIKFGILVVLQPNPGYHIRFSDGDVKCKN